MRLLISLSLAVAAVLALQAAPITPPDPSDPFAFLAPTVTIDADTRRSIDAGRPYAKVLPAQDRELAILAIVSVNVDGGRLVSWMREIEQLKKGSYILAIGRFSDPPRIDDLAGLMLDQPDLDELRQCKPGDCGLKLGAAEIQTLQQLMVGSLAEWEPAVQAAFRRLMLERVQAYQRDGQAALPHPADHRPPVDPSAVFASLVSHSPYLVANLPEFSTYLTQYPRAPLGRVEQLIYWSKEKVGNKPIVSITHLNILRMPGCAAADTLVAAKQIFATHYMNGSLSLTGIVHGCSGQPNYLVYVNRSQVDVLGGFWGGLVRLIVERRVKGESADILKTLRQRLESGEPD
jgi:hypothetical protein